MENTTIKTKKLPDFLSRPATEKQKALLKRLEIEFNDDITILDFKELKRKHFLLIKPTDGQVNYVRDLVGRATADDRAYAKKYFSKYGINSHTVSVIIEILSKNQKEEVPTENYDINIGL